MGPFVLVMFIVALMGILLMSFFDRRGASGGRRRSRAYLGWMAGCLTLLLGCVAAPSMAQGVSAAPNCLAVKLGALWPSSALTAHNTGAYQGSADIELSLADLYANKTASPLVPALYIDYNAASKTGGFVNCLGAGASLRAYSERAGTPGNVYIGAGVGGYYEGIKNTEQLRTIRANNLDVGWKAFLGVDVSPNLCLEAGYQDLPPHAGVNPSGPYIQAGVRF